MKQLKDHEASAKILTQAGQELSSAIELNENLILII